MSANVLENPSVVIQQSSGDVNAPQPVGNLTVEFEVDFFAHFAACMEEMAETEDRADIALIESRKLERRESMDKVFSELGIK